MALPNPKFEASYGRLFGTDVGLGGVGDQFFTAFYERFLASPDVADLFQGTDMSAQVQMLKRSLFHLATFYITGEPSSELKRLAELHGKLKLGGGLFDDWLRALMETVKEFDPQADEATELAWAWALTPGITYMRMALPAQFSAWQDPEDSKSSEEHLE